MARKKRTPVKEVEDLAGKADPGAQAGTPDDGFQEIVDAVDAPADKAEVSAADDQEAGVEAAAVEVAAVEEEATTKADAVEQFEKLSAPDVAEVVEEPCPYVTTRRIKLNRALFLPNTFFPGKVPLTEQQAGHLLESGAIRRAGEPPKPAPDPAELILGDELTGDGEEEANVGRETDF